MITAAQQVAVAVIAALHGTEFHCRCGEYEYVKAAIEQQHLDAQRLIEPIIADALEEAALNAVRVMSAEGGDL